MGILRDRRWLDASRSFRGGAGRCLDAIAESTEGVRNVEYERIWYQLGLSRPDMSKWFQHCVETFGRILPYQPKQLNNKEDPIFFLWGRTDVFGGLVGTLSKIDQERPDVRLLELLGSGGEPDAYHIGTTTAQEVLLGLLQRIEGGEKFKTISSVGPSYFSVSLAQELLHVELREPVLFPQSDRTSFFFFECLWQHDADKHGLRDESTAQSGEPLNAPLGDTAKRFGLICSDCEIRVPRSSQFCPECGKPLEEEVQDDPSCPNPECEAIPLEGAAFCDQCGTDVKAEA
jgi:hypothetical protein